MKTFEMPELQMVDDMEPGEGGNNKCDTGKGFDNTCTSGR